MIEIAVILLVAFGGLAWLALVEQRRSERERVNFYLRNAQYSRAFRLAKAFYPLVPAFNQFAVRMTVEIGAMVEVARLAQESMERLQRIFDRQSEKASAELQKWAEENL